MGLKIFSGSIIPSGSSTQVSMSNLVMTGSQSPVMLNLTADQSLTNFVVFGTTGGSTGKNNIATGAQ